MEAIPTKKKKEKTKTSSTKKVSRDKEKKTKKSKSNKILSISEVNIASAPLESTINIEFDETSIDIANVNAIAKESEPIQEHKDFLNVSYPFLYNMMENNTNQTKEQEIPISTKVYLPQSSQNTFSVKNQACTICSYERTNEESIMILGCGHFQHLICSLENKNTKEIYEQNKCGICLQRGLIPITQAQEKKQNEKVISGTFEQEILRTLREKRKSELKSGISDYIEDRLFESEEENEEDNSINVSSNEQIKRTTIDQHKLFDLFSDVGLIKVSQTRVAWDAIASLVGNGEVSSYLNDNKETFDYDFLVKKKITLDNLSKAGFTEEDIYNGLLISSVDQLKELKLKPSHFMKKNKRQIWSDFEQFVDKYSPSWKQLDEAFFKSINQPLYLDWILKKTKGDVTLLKKLSIDFDVLIKDLAFGTEEFVQFSWPIEKCLKLGMTKNHLFQLGLNALHFDKVTWLNDRTKLKKSFDLNPKDLEKLYLHKNFE